MPRRRDNGNRAAICTSGAGVPGHAGRACSRGAEGVRSDPEWSGPGHRADPPVGGSGALAGMSGARLDHQRRRHRPGPVGAGGGGDR